MSELTDQLDGATTVLLEAPAMGADRGVCSSLLTEGLDDPGILFVTFTRQATTCIDELGEAADGAGALGVITVGDAASDVDREGVHTQNVSSPSDLTGLGIQIGQVLSEWDAPVTVCFDSLTSMLQYVDFETAYEFLHALTGQFYSANARAHFHVDPSAHEATQVAGITSLVDAAIQVEDEPIVRARDVMT